MSVIVAIGVMWSAQAADWTTHRGNAERTGCIDGMPGPTRPRVIWTHASREHFVASLVAAGERLYLPALGAFNSGAFHAVDLTEAPAKRILWTKSPPVLRIPTVCSPVVAGGKIVFGEGMHQTEGASLLCLRASDGRLSWRLNVTGELVHIEGSPTVADGRVFLGAGSGGVICADLNLVTLDGKEVSAAEVEASIEKRWKELVAKYEQDLKKECNFAIPPNEMSLPQPAPQVWWVQGRDAWHVDGPTVAADGRVLAGSAYLDVEKKGDRALYCMDARDGRVIWKVPLKYNPWGGPSVSGGRVLVSTSSIRYDPQQVGSAAGEVVALRLSDGSVEWRRDAGAGVLGAVAVAGGLAIFTDTAGRVVALDAVTGEPRWEHKGEAPYFAGPAVSGGAVYAADLKGVVRALGLKDGKPLWRLDAAAAAGSPGMVYGSPVLHRGRLYVATCNIEGASAGQGTALICIGD